MKNLISILLLSGLISACGKTNKGSKSHEINLSNPYASTEIDSGLDSDGDGVSDKEETEAGTDPYIANIPKLDFQVFKELSLNVEFYNQRSGSYKVENLLINNSEVKTGWNNKTYPSLKGGLYMGALLRSYAVNTGFSQNGFKFNDYNEGIYSISSPVLFENTLIEISNKVLDHERDGFRIRSLNAKILAKILVNSSKHKYFSRPVFDIYYKSKNRDDLVFIESKVITGVTYAFGKEVDIYFDFESYDPQIINDSVLSGGASFFLKLRDFSIYETGETYSQILARVRTKSIPVTIAYPSGDEVDNSTFETSYVGTNGGKSKLTDLLKKTLRNEVLLTDTSIDVIKGLPNDRRAYRNGQNETSKWFIGSSIIGNNVFYHNFDINEGVGLAYLSDKKIEHKPIFVSRSAVSTHENYKSSGLLPSGTNDIKIKIFTKYYKRPHETIEPIRENCGPNYDSGWLYYNRTNVSWNHITKSNDLLLNHGTISIASESGEILSGPIKELVESGLINMSEDLSDNSLVISLSKKIKDSLPKSADQVSLNLRINPGSVFINVGNLQLTGRTCHRERPAGSGGRWLQSRAVGTKGIRIPATVAGQEYFDEFDLNVHFLAY